MRRPAISSKRCADLGWIRIDPRPWTKLRAHWQHRDGWLLEHCGHPTATFQWALYDPMGRMHLRGVLGGHSPVCGRAWASLEEAMKYVDAGGSAGIVAMDLAEVERPGDIRRAA